ncbi:RrF2 family transcriptional regulator [Demequina silvatica]|uniref:RrF2 family transcriptional regulator n=1 Tax=Demequina silvatica TaxID=1638988 RepID=UPI000783D581|nr:Rrf2 family transcriptional regulator [Demequina silvatica]
MHVTAKGDYAVRAVVGLAEAYPARVPVAVLAERFEMPRKFLETALADLRRAGIVQSMRGPEGGYVLHRPPSEITVGEVVRAIDGPLADVHGLRPHEVVYPDGLQHMQEVWVAARAAVRMVFDEVTVDQLVTGAFPDQIRDLFLHDQAWEPRSGPQTPTLPSGTPPAS